MVDSVQLVDDKEMEPSAPVASTSQLPIAGQPVIPAPAQPGPVSSPVHLNGRQPDAPGRTGRGPAVTASAGSYPSTRPGEYETVHTRLPFRDSRHEDYFRAGEAEREAQRVMIAAQRETIRAGDSVIEALRQQVRQLQARLDHTASINNSLRMQQYELLRAEQTHERNTSSAPGLNRPTLAPVDPTYIQGWAQAAYTGSAQASTSNTASPLARHLGVAPGASTTRIADAERARVRRDQMVQEAMETRRNLLEQREQAISARLSEARLNNDDVRLRRTYVRSTRDDALNNPSRQNASGNQPSPPRENWSDSEDSDIYADMPPLEALSGSSAPSSPRPAPAELPARPADFATTIPSLPAPETSGAREHQSAALERLRADPHFRTRIQNYMQPETARRILEVLDARPATTTLANTTQQADSSSGGQGQHAYSAVPGTPYSEERNLWEILKGHRDADGDIVKPGAASTLAEERRRRRLANISVGR